MHPPPQALQSSSCLATPHPSCHLQSLSSLYSHSLNPSSFLVIRRFTLFNFLLLFLILFLLCNLIGFFNLFTLCILHLLLCNLLPVLPLLILLVFCNLFLLCNFLISSSSSSFPLFLLILFFSLLLLTLNFLLFLLFPLLHHGHYPLFSLPLSSPSSFSPSSSTCSSFPFPP